MLRKSTLVLMILIGLAAVATVFINPLRYHRRDLKSCFDDVAGLQAGASVRIAGVLVGTVRSVRADPQNKNCPAEVEMVLSTDYEIRVPKDSIAEIKSALLGGADLSIDTTHASGTPIENYGYLKSKPSKEALSLGDQVRAADAVLHLVQALKETEKKVPESGNAPTRPPNP
jgi:phospholipid/cholesterol/gamma-HCH transport system substrate-binding protein